ncbi:MAG TPA: hypothetical protein VFY39_01435 [Gammaproteobacteria bacterium]|nr:hypothetical protein [Gammaproteobacteria bacterium]
MLALTLAASYPMVGFYATFAEPGLSRQFYLDAAPRVAHRSGYPISDIPPRLCRLDG